MTHLRISPGLSVLHQEAELVSTVLQGSGEVYLGDLPQGLCGLLLQGPYLGLPTGYSCLGKCPVQKNHLSPLVKQQAGRNVDFAFG